MAPPNVTSIKALKCIFGALKSPDGRNVNFYERYLKASNEGDNKPHYRVANVYCNQNGEVKLKVIDVDNPDYEQFVKRFELGDYSHTILEFYNTAIEADKTEVAALIPLSKVRTNTGIKKIAMYKIHTTPECNLLVNVAYCEKNGTKFEQSINYVFLRRTRTRKAENPEEKEENGDSKVHSKIPWSKTMPHIPKQKRKPAKENLITSEDSKAER